VTDGTNAHLAALDADGALSTEAAIVDARRRNLIRSIFLLDREPPPISREPRAAIDERLAAHAACAANPRVLGAPRRP
jgi:hypothetical protein